LVFLSEEEIDEQVFASVLAEKYNKEIDRESAYELLNGKIAEAQSAEVQEELKQQEAMVSKRRQKNEPSLLETLSKNTMVRQVGNTLLREITRGIFGILGLGGSSRRKTTRKRTSKRRR